MIIIICILVICLVVALCKLITEHHWHFEFEDYLMITVIGFASFFLGVLLTYMNI